MIVQGDCVALMAELAPGSVDAIVTDPPYSLGFMGRSWDSHGENEDAGFGYYLAGLIDGEGHFRVGAGERRCEFGMKMRADDEWILRQAIGFIRHGRITHEPRRDGSAPQAKLIIDTKDGCAALCSLLMRYPLRAKKLRDFLTWAEAVDEWLTMPRGNRWHGPADRARLAELGTRIREGRGYSEIPWSGNAFQDWCRLWGREAMRVLKPGGHLLAFGGTRTYHRLAAGLEDSGFEIRDTLAFMYGSGFPKSLDVSKAIDKAAGAEREIVGISPHFSEGRNVDNFGVAGEGLTEQRDRSITAPATPEAQQWQGWGTALKPAHEPIVLARKPLAGTVAQNVQANGTGALAIDACRIGFQGEADERESKDKNRHADFGSGPRDNRIFGADERARGENGNYDPPGRWPANVLLDEEAAGMLDEQSGEGRARGNISPTASGVGMFYKSPAEQPVDPGDTGGASRFFYVAKASSAERNAGLEGFEEQERRSDYGTVGNAVPHMPEGYVYEGKRRNVHPTVKPIELMRWLVRLITPPGGVVLDPFTGSGTTGCAAALEGFDFIGFEREAEYVAIAEARIRWWSQHPDGLEIVKSLEAERERQKIRDTGQLGLGIA
jgi:DNA modification methylase